MTRADPLVEAIRDLAPADEPMAPIPGSVRFESLWQDTVHRLAGSQMEQTRPRMRTRRAGPLPASGARRARRLVAAVGAAVCAAGGVVVASSLSDDTPSAAAAIAEAATLTGDVRSFRAELIRTTTTTGGEVVERDRATVEVSGDRAHGTATSSDDPPLELIVIGDTVWDCLPDGTWERRVPEERLDPFAAASAALVDAVLTSDAVEELGDEPVGGVAATRYRLQVEGAARQRLAALPESTLGWFDLDDHPSDLRGLDVWIGEEDGLIHRIDTTSSEPIDDDTGVVTARITFSDFGEPIDIQPPTATRC